MAQPGDQITHPDTRERLTFLKTSDQTGSEHVRVLLDVEPGGINAPAQIYPRIGKQVEIVRGAWALELNGAERRLGAGDCLLINAGQPHRYWNAGDAAGQAVIVYRPALAIEQYLETIFGLAQDGLTDPDTGLPAQPWLALMLTGCLAEIAYPAEPGFADLRETLRPIADEARRQGLCIPCPYPYPYQQQK